jgi:predicted amidophosphoribosyltransferase
MPSAGHCGPPNAIGGQLSCFTAACRYDGLVSRIVLAAKNGGRHDVLRVMVEAMAVSLPMSLDVDVVTWVPASRGRRRRRGYDQGEILARGVARRLGVRARPLLRRGRGETQANLGRVDRLVGPSVTAARAVPPRVLLVDDVATTGASIAASATALRAGGAHTVDGVVFAIVEDS